MKICQCGMPMNDAGEPLQAGDNHDYPCPKLLEQHPFLKRELNHLLGHGSYVFEDCCDQEGSIFEKVMTVSGQVARTMIAEAIADRLPKEQSCFFSKTYLDIQPEDWMTA